MSSVLTYIAIAIFLGSQTANGLQESVQFQANGYNYTHTPGIGAHRVATGQTTWNEARRICNDQGGHLAIVNSVAEAEAIGRLLRAVNAVYGWVGVHDLYQEGEFVTIHGESLAQTGFDVWRAGEPNNLGNIEHCVTLTPSGQMYDVPCSTRTHYICELRYTQLCAPTPTQPTGIADPGLT